MNCLKAGIALADLITTVSPRYAREISEPKNMAACLTGGFAQTPALLVVTSTAWITMNGIP